MKTSTLHGPAVERFRMTAVVAALAAAGATAPAGAVQVFPMSGDHAFRAAESWNWWISDDAYADAADFWRYPPDRAARVAWPRGGHASGTAATTLGGVSYTGDTSKIISGVVTLTGDSSWSGNTVANGNTLVFESGIINNGATFTDSNAFNALMQNYSGPNAFNNAGAYVKNGASTSTIQVAFNNSGSTTVNAGRLELDGNDRSSGSFSVASGATLAFANGTHNLNGVTVSGGGTLEIGGSTSYSFVNVNGGTLSSAVLISGGNLQGRGATFTGPASWTGGEITGPGTDTFSGSFTITGNGSKYLYGGRVLALTGDANWSNNTSAGGNTIVFGGGTLSNIGTFTDANAFNAVMQNYTGINDFDNEGAYTKTGTGTTTIQVPYDNTGTTSVNAGRLELAGGGTDSGTFSIASGATLAFTSGTHNLNAATVNGRGTLEVAGSTSYSFVNVNGGKLSSAVLISGGNLQGRGATFAGPASWTGGEITGPGTDTFSGSFTVTGDGSKYLYGGRVLALSGAGKWTGNTAASGNTIVFGGGTLANTGTFTDANSFNAVMQNYTGINDFANVGSYTKTGAATTTIQVAYDNTGSTNVNAGRLELAGGGTDSGKFTIASGATLAFTNGTHSLNAATVSGRGKLEISGSTSYSFVNVNGGTYSAPVLVGGGNLQGRGATFTGQASWTGGEMTGPGTHAFTGPFTITGDGSKYLYGGRVLALSGASSWSGNSAASGNTVVFGGGTLVNAGTFSDANSFNALMQSYTGINDFENTGSYTKTGSATTTIQVAYNNTGVTSIRSGTLAFTGSLQNTGTITGAGTLAAPTAGFVNDGAISPGLAGAGKLAITGNLTLDPTSTLDLDLASLTKSDLLAVSGTATLGGEISIHDAGYAPAVGDSFVVMTYAQNIGASVFSGIDLQGFAPGVGFNLVYNATNVTLDVVSAGAALGGATSPIAAVPEPSEGMLLVGGLGVLGLLMRRRASVRR
ncbi:MAG: hypothetical protein JSR59_00780 [Proteobacteria bacterium]|nr:hypothetical protein [Pseudomonadota bacterium]